MRYILVLIIALVSLAFHNSDSKFTEQSNLINLWHNAAASANFDAYFNAVTDDFVFLGTAPGERWNKKEFMAFSKPYFDKGKAWNFTSRNKRFKVLKKNKIVAFDEDLDTWMEGCRGSGVLVKEKGKWKISYYNLTVLIENEKIDDFIQLRKEK